MYNHNLIEKKWIDIWEKSKINLFIEDKSKPKYFLLDAIPYPSGAGLHLGHIKAFSATEMISRYKKMCGFNVLHATGWDAFGLPAEQFAITNGASPQVYNKKNISYFKHQLKSIGFDYADNREIDSTDSKYYEWTQWIFLKLLEKGLAVKQEVEVNWCSGLSTVLANDEIVEKDGVMVSDRGGFPVEKRLMNQWILKITDYADKLDERLADLTQWPDSTKSTEHEWIGRSKGATIHFKTDNGVNFDVFTTRPDTIYGVTFIAFAPENELVKQITIPSKEEEIKAYIKLANSKTELQRKEETKDKTGVFTGTYAINPLNGKKIPIYVADYVLNNYATGIVMGVPAHDERDWDFAKNYKLDISFVIKSDSENECYSGDGEHINSDIINGLNKEQAIDKIIKVLEEKNLGKSSVTYKLRNWTFSRQRYWGEPIPILYDEKGQISVENELPVVLPETDDLNSIKPSGDGSSPLSSFTDWVNVQKNGKHLKRETDTMPGSAATSWFPLAFITKQDDGSYLPLDSKEAQELFARWMPADYYVCGSEHNTGHILYMRFWFIFLKEIGIIKDSTPVIKLINQGLILGPDGKKMSKSKGNTIDPMNVVETHGADALRLYAAFMGPYCATLPWSPSGLDGMRRWIDRVYRFYTELIKETTDNENEIEPSLNIAYNKLVRNVTRSLDSSSFNICISEMMIYINECYKNTKFYKKHLLGFLSILSCFAPFISEEINIEVLKNKTPISQTKWPTFDEALTIDKLYNLPISENGKHRHTIEILRDTPEAEVIEKVMAEERIISILNGRKPKKIIYIPNKIVNIII